MRISLAATMSVVTVFPLSATVGSAQEPPLPCPLPRVAVGEGEADRQTAKEPGAFHAPARWRCPSQGPCRRPA